MGYLLYSLSFFFLILVGSKSLTPLNPPSTTIKRSTHITTTTHTNLGTHH